jgi:hypothetical protein
LERVWQDSRGGVGIGTAAVATDDVNTGMSYQPCLNALALTVWQEVNYLMAIEVNEDRAITASLTLCPIVDPQGCWCCDSWVG